MEILEFDPKFLITAKFNANIDFDAKSPKWECFLNELFNNNQEKIKYLQNVIGYVVSQDKKGDVAFVIKGDGFYGRQVFLTVLQEIFPVYAVKKIKGMYKGSRYKQREIEFNNEISKDKHLIDNLLQERDGILRWIIEGLIDYKKYGFKHKMESRVF